MEEAINSWSPNDFPVHSLEMRLELSTYRKNVPSSGSEIPPAATKQRVRFSKLAIVRTEDKEFTWEYLEVEIQSAFIYSGR